MAQQLKVYKDPSVVASKPTTNLESLQNAIDKAAKTYVPTQQKVNAASWPAAVGNVYRDIGQSIPGPSTPPVAPRENARVPSGMELGFGVEAGPKIMSPAVDAIDNATGRRATGVPGHGQTAYGKMPTDSDVPLNTPGFQMRQSAKPLAKTLFRQSAKPLAKTLFRQAAKPAPAAKPIASAPNVTKNVDRYLSEQGKDTNFASEGQRANAYMKALFG